MSGPLPRFLAPVTVPASWAYERLIAARNARFDRGRGVQRVERPVISVGNITTGGTGKTPMVMWLAQQLIDAGHKPAIAMRGYKSFDGKSDEQLEYADRLPDVPVIANPDRAAAIREFLPAHPEIDGVILDDGFQHRQLHRDLDLVLIDATAATFNDRMLPAGNLREPLANLRRPDAVILTHAESEISNLKSQIEVLHGRPPLAATRHVWRELEIHENAATTKRVGVDWLRGTRVVTMLGIGKPASVDRQLQSLDVVILQDLNFGDHHQYKYEDLDAFDVAVSLNSKDDLGRDLTGDRPCDALVITGKDWVKIRNLIDWNTWTLPIAVPRLEIEFLYGEDALRDLALSTVRKTMAGKPAG